MFIVDMWESIVTVRAYGKVQSGHAQTGLGHVGRRRVGMKWEELGTRYSAQEVKGTKG